MAMPPEGPPHPTPPPPAPPRRFSRDTTPERRDRFKSSIAVLIGIVSLTGAVATWRSVDLGNQATDADRQAVIETVLREQSRARSETALRSEQSYFTRYRAGLAAADRLDEQAEALREEGNDTEAQALEEDSQVFRELADSLSALTFNSSYVTETESAALVFDEEGRRRDIERADIEASQVDPEQTVAKADSLHTRSLRLVRLIVALVGVIVLLTLAQLSKVTFRPFIAGIAVLLYLTVSLVALFGDRT